MFNPIKSVTTIVTTTVTVLLLGYTHLEAFRLGLGISQNPLIRTTEQMLGLISPPAPCPTPAGQPDDDAGRWDIIP